METHDIDNAQTMVYTGIDSMVLFYLMVAVRPKLGSFDRPISLYSSIGSPFAAFARTTGQSQESSALGNNRKTLGPKRRGVVFVGNATRQLEVMP